MPTIIVTAGLTLLTPLTLSAPRQAAAKVGGARQAARTARTASGTDRAFTATGSGGGSGCGLGGDRPDSWLLLVLLLSIEIVRARKD